MIRRGIAIGDLHSGSNYAPLPPNFEAYDGAVKPWNPAQEYLWKCWDNFTWRAHNFDPEYIIVNADCIEGPQRKSSGYEVCLPSMEDQVRACVGVLSLLKGRCPNAKWFFTQGTPYHVGDWNGAEEAIAKQMGGETYPSVGFGKYCREVLWLGLDGIILEATHHPAGSSTGFYRMTVLDRDAQWAAMAAKDASKGIPKADLHIRSHLHFFGGLEHASKQVVQLPCWKLGDNHSRKGGLYRFLPDLGGTFIESDIAWKERGNAPCRVTKELYSLPPVKIYNLPSPSPPPTSLSS